MNEIDSNRDAWSRLSQDHYQTYKAALTNGTHCLNEHIQRELGDLAGKEIIHLQCNTGADTIALARMGAARVVGVDLSPENIAFARRLANDLHVDNVEFVASDVLKLTETYTQKHDLVFTSEGVLGWLPELGTWARTVRALLRDTGGLYVFDSHPTYLMFDETKLCEENYDIKYPYFGKEPDVSDSIGGYASEVKSGVRAYFWMHTLSELFNSLIDAGLCIDRFNEFPENFFDCGGMPRCEKAGLYRFPFNQDKYPMSYSLRAHVYPGR